MQFHLENIRKRYLSLYSFLWVNSADDILVIVFLFFPENRI